MLITKIVFVVFGFSINQKPFAKAKELKTDGLAVKKSLCKLVPPKIYSSAENVKVYHFKNPNPQHIFSVTFHKRKVILILNISKHTEIYTSFLQSPD